MLYENDIKINYYDTEDKRYIELPETIDVYTHIQVKDKIIELLKDTEKSPVLNLEKMVFIESSGISVIVTIQKLLEDENRKLYLTNLNESIIEVIDFCKINYNVI